MDFRMEELAAVSIAMQLQIIALRHLRRQHEKQREQREQRKQQEQQELRKLWEKREQLEQREQRERWAKQRAKRERQRAKRAQQKQQEQQEEAGRKRKRRFAVHPLWKNRDVEGELFLFRETLADNEEKFCEYFRMSRGCFSSLLLKIQDQLTKQHTHFRSPLSPAERLAVCLRFLVTGDSVNSISSSFLMGQATVHQIVKETCRAITDTLLAETMPTPTMEMWETIKLQFWEKWQFPNCLGAIDGKHINMRTPPNSKPLYINGNKAYSIVLMGLADANSNFTTVEVVPFGNNAGSDGMFAQSRLGRFIIDGTYQMLPDANFPGTSTSAPCVFVASEAFPLRRNVLKPYPAGQAEGHDDKTNFNMRLTDTRRAVDNAFDILLQRFRIVNTRMLSRPEKITSIILTACILHNYIRSYDGFQRTDQEANARSPTWDMCSHHGDKATKEAFAVRKQFRDFLFASRGSHVLE